MNKLVLPAFVAASLVAVPAFAGKDHRYDRDDRYEPRYGNTEYADVLEARPRYRTVRIEEPRRECWDERVVYRDEPRGGRDDYYLTNGTAGAVIGAIAGGVAGHQFGKGRGKDAATALGAIIGAGVGQRVAVQNYPRDRGYDRGDYERVGYEERCRTINDYREEQRVDGYDVTYRYGGRTYHTTLPHDPGRRMPVDVNVQPVRY